MNNKDRVVEYLVKLKTNPNDKTELFNEYQDELMNMSSEDTFEVMTELKKNHFSEMEILDILDMVIHVFYASLKEKRPQIENRHPYIDVMLKEQEVLNDKFDEIRPLLKEKQYYQIRPIIESLKQYYPHYEKKENLLFPLLEKKDERFEGLTIMWALHNEIKKRVDTTLMFLNEHPLNPQDVIESVSQLFFDFLGMNRKEELILIPQALEVITQEEFDDLYQQSLEYDPVLNIEQETKQEEKRTIDFSSDLIVTPTGHLTLEQIFMIFETLELDMTFVDENDKVCYFTKPKDRIFPRSAAVIGREVKNCHPPQSVHIVEEIVDNFKQHKQDKASFWIDMRGRKILIQYYALRNQEGQYKGTLEVSQDITEIQKLEGQMRLAQYSQK